MNIVIIVGHPASGFEDVESRLQQCGMKAALPSRREGVLPKDISNALCIAHQAPAPEAVTSESGFRQIEAGVVWHGVALDLLLGNLEQELWGWSDTRCIFLLDYWRMLDPKITFVLVYDEPQRAIAEAALHESGELDEKKIQRLLANWAAYNGAMLGFFLRNPERCLLAHAQLVHRSLEDHLAQLRSRLNAPPEVASAVLRDHGITGADAAIAPTIRSMAAPLTRALNDALALVSDQPTNALDAFHSDPAERFIIQGVISGYPECLQLYEELQSAANLPLNTGETDVAEHGTAWKALIAQRQFIAQILGELHRKYQSLEEQTRNTSLEHHLLQEQFLELRSELASAVTQNLEQTAILRNFQQTERQAAEYRLKIRELQLQIEGSAEDQAVTQGLLRQIQIELENCHSENLSLHQSYERHVVEHKVAMDAMLQTLQHAEYLAEERQIKIRELQGQSGMNGEDQAVTQSLLRQIQNDLEASLRENLSLRKTCEEQATVHKLAMDAILLDRQQAERLAEEDLQGIIALLAKEKEQHPQDLSSGLANDKSAERIKQQLSYRLGSTIVSQSRSLGGWLGMPFAVSRTIRDFNKSRNSKNG